MINDEEFETFLSHLATSQLSICDGVNSKALPEPCLWEQYQFAS